MKEHYRDMIKNKVVVWAKAEKVLINAYSRKELINLWREYYEDNNVNNVLKSLFVNYS